MNRKDKTVKQLQAECRKRKVGFMMNWTKVALIKRLEDEDKRDKEILELEKRADKVLVKKEGELSKALNKIDMANSEAAIAKKALGKLDKKTIKQNAIDSLITQKQTMMTALQFEFDALQKQQDKLLKANNIVAHKKAKINSEIKSIELLIKSLI
jgi:hypothetical protein